MWVIIVCSIFSVLCAVASLVIVAVMIRKANLNTRDERKRETKLFKLYEALEEMIDDFEKYVNSSKAEIAYTTKRTNDRQQNENKPISPNIDVAGAINIESKSDDQFLRDLYTNPYTKIPTNEAPAKTKVEQRVRQTLYGGYEPHKKQDELDFSRGNNLPYKTQIPVQKPFQTQIIASEEPKRGRGRPRKNDETVKRVPPKVNLITNDNVVPFAESQSSKPPERIDDIFSKTVEPLKAEPIPKDPKQEIFRLLDEGKSVDEIAKILKRSRGEIELIKGFKKF